MKKLLLILLALIGTLNSCKDSKPTDLADSIYINGKIYTVNEAQPWAEAVAIKDGKFLLVGTDDEIMALKGDETEIVDLDGKFVMPGMIDVHTHAIESHVPSVVRLKNPGDADKLVAEVKAYVEANPEKEWYLFGDFAFGLFPGDNGPKELLDFAPDKAIAIMHASGHAFWANSKALELAGITADTPDPEKGIITRLENGVPQGGLQESAMAMIWAAAPKFTPAEIEESVEFANKMYAAAGITATREAGQVPSRWDVLEKMAKQGKVKTRYKVAAHWETSITLLHPNNEDVKSFLLENKDKESDIAKLDALKIVFDGVPASRTSLMKKPFLDKPDSYGVQNTSTENLNKTVADYDKLGVLSVIHVVGDEAAKRALDAVEGAQKANGVSGLRHNLSHNVVVDKADLPRYKELGVVADFSPFFPYYGPTNTNHIAAVGEERFSKWWAMKSMMDQGIVTAIATDYPVAELNPFVGMEAGVTRLDPHGSTEEPMAPEEAISIEQAIKAYTWNPAYILGWEDKIGSIENGKLADMVILDQNPMEISAADISEIKVMKTFLAGETIFDANSDMGMLTDTDKEQSRLLALNYFKSTEHDCSKHF